MTRAETIRAAIVSGIQLADDTDKIWDRFRDPKLKNRDSILDIFGENIGTKAERIHGWHFDRSNLPNYQIEGEEGSQEMLTHDENYAVEGFLSFVDAGENPSTYEWQEIMDGFAEAMFGCPEIQALQQEYNLTLVRVSIDANSFTFLTGEMKCHWAQITLDFQTII